MKNFTIYLLYVFLTQDKERVTLKTNNFKNLFKKIDLVFTIVLPMTIIC